MVKIWKKVEISKVNEFKGIRERVSSWVNFQNEENGYDFRSYDTDENPISTAKIWITQRNQFNVEVLSKNDNHDCYDFDPQNH